MPSTDPATAPHTRADHPPDSLPLAVLPSPDADTVAAAEAAGGVVVPLDRARALAWTDSDPSDFPRDLPSHIDWVQLPSAGIERWIQAGIVDDVRRWTSAVGAYADPVAEHAATLLLAGVHRLQDCVRADTWTKTDLWPHVGTVRGSTVAIVGCGSIGRALIPILAALGCEIVAVNRSGRPVPGAAETLGADRANEAWARADHFVVAAPATDDTHHLVSYDQLGAMRPHSWVVNVARGSLVDTEALVESLDAGRIGGAALDVTDPEPLPAGHPLWNHPRAIITPHVANPIDALRANLNARLADNVARYLDGRPLTGVVDLAAGY